LELFITKKRALAVITRYLLLDAEDRESDVLYLWYVFAEIEFTLVKHRFIVAFFR